MGTIELPRVSIVYLVYNRREELAVSLEQMLGGGYPRDRLEVIVVDNASTDDTAAYVREHFSDDVQLIVNPANVGASGWNSGFAKATGDYVLILDDDCYLPGDGLLRAVQEAEAQQADLVSFKVISSFDDAHYFNDIYETGLLSYWGCAALLSRRALDVLGGYDPYIFIWANELELTIRLFDAGFRHLHLPDIEAVHIKPPGPQGFILKAHRYNHRHYGYIAAKLLQPGDAARVMARLQLQMLLDIAVDEREAYKAFPDMWAGFAAGLRNRSPVRPVVSRAYRDNFRAWAKPRELLRGPAERLRGEDHAEARHAAYFERRRDYYPADEGTLAF